MEPHDYLVTLRKQWLVIVILGVIGLIAAIAANAVLPTSYTARSSVFVSTLRGETSADLVQGSTYTQNLVQSYAQLATAPIVLERVVEELDLPVSARQLGGSITADTPLNTVIIDIAVVNRDPRAAAQIADAVADELSAVVEELAPGDGAGQSAVTLSTIAPAQVPSFATSPNTRLILISGLLGGLILGVLYALAREIFDTRIRSERDVERTTRLPLLGNIGRTRSDAGVTMLREPYGHVAEDVRRLRVNLEFVELEGGIRSLIVTSPLPGDGKTTTAVNLAIALAERERRVLLVDADLRRSNVDAFTQLDGSLGVTTVLLGQADLPTAVQPWPAGRLDVLAAGPVPPNPDQLLGSTGMKRLIEEATDRYDIVVIDSAPLLPVADTLSLSRIVDAVVIVGRTGRTRRPVLAQAIGSLESIRARVVGVVLNGSPQSGRGVPYYRYRSDEAAAAAGDHTAQPASDPDRVGADAVALPPGPSQPYEPSAGDARDDGPSAPASARASGGQRPKTPRSKPRR